MFISDIGGSAGLILGISFLSIIKLSIQAFNIVLKKSLTQERLSNFFYLIRQNLIRFLSVRKKAKRAVMSKLSQTNQKRKVSQSDLQKKISSLFNDMRKPQTKSHDAYAI